MGRVITNGMTLSYAREASLGVLPGSPVWFIVEPNTINTFGTTISKETRTPISRARARRKGTVTDLDSGVEFEGDVTLSHIRDFMEPFLFARAVGPDAYMPSAAAAPSYTVPALSAGQAGRLTYGVGAAASLLYAVGFKTSTNNGLKVLSAAVAAGATAIPVAGGLTVEAVAADQRAELFVAGVRGAAGDIEIDANGDIISTVLDFTTLGLTVGQSIHVGGVDATHQFFTDANFGFARLAAIAAHKLTLEKRDAAFTVDDGTDTGAGGANLQIDLLFGQFIRNVPVGHADYLEPSTQFELASPNLMSAGATGYEYAVGNWADAISMTIPLRGKATVSFGFVGTDTTLPSAVRATNAENAKVPVQTAAYGSASDIARLRAQDVDEAGLTTDFKSVTFTLTNNIAGEKVIAQLPAKYLNAGDLEVDVEAQVLFTNPDMIERIRCNRTVGLDWVLRNGDGGVAFDIPTGTFDGGGREYPANQSVLMNTTLAAHQETDLEFTLGVSFFPILPAQACA